MELVLKKKTRGCSGLRQCNKPSLRTTCPWKLKT
jgi:hypothetical protein